MSRDIIFYCLRKYLLSLCFRSLHASINNAAFSIDVKSNLTIIPHCEIPLNITEQLHNIQIMKIFHDLSGQHLKQWMTLIIVGCLKIR